MKRALKPRATAAIGIAPIYVSDLTAPIFVGLEAHAFRSLVADLRIPHVRRGHRVLVAVETLTAALTAVTSGATEATADAEPTATDILRSLGRRAS